jgi:hypothetical protein
MTVAGGTDIRELNVCNFDGGSLLEDEPLQTLTSLGRFAARTRVYCVRISHERKKRLRNKRAQPGPISSVAVQRSVSADVTRS